MAGYKPESGRISIQKFGFILGQIKIVISANRILFKSSQYILHFQFLAREIPVHLSMK